MKFQDLVVVAYGGGTDTTAMLIEMVNRQWPAPYAIVFADTGGEHPHTYAHLWRFSAWLQERGYPAIRIVRSASVGGETLENMCLRLGCLPSVAYGWKTCSQRFKLEPQEKWRNNDPLIRMYWEYGVPITTLVGFEYGEQRRVSPTGTWKVVNRYPLIEWKMTREDCIETIAAAGMSLPGKSSCFFCPNMKKTEVLALGQMYPDLLQRALAMEAAAEASGKNKKVVGLGRRYAWRDLVNGAPTPPVAEVSQPCGCFDGDEDLVVPPPT